LAASTRRRELRIVEVDGVPALQAQLGALLERGGFRVEPGGLVLGG
jgi:hypothetical protein